VQTNAAWSPDGKEVAAFVELLEADEPVVVPSIVLQELLSGVKTEAAFARLDEALSRFPLLLPTRATHVQAAHLRNRCRAHGAAAATVDCLIAAHMIAVGGRFFTFDEDFQRIAKLSDLEFFKI
jgi:predicted nucleic acid-binding protein